MTMIHTDMTGSILMADGIDDITMSEDLNMCIMGIHTYIKAYLFGSLYGMVQINHRQSIVQCFDMTGIYQ